MTAYRPGTPRIGILIVVTVAGLFVAGFGYGYVAPSDDGWCDDFGNGPVSSVHLDRISDPTPEQTRDR